MDDSDESDDDAETDINNAMELQLVHPASQRDATWETQSDVTVPTKNGGDDDMTEEQGTPAAPAVVSDTPPTASGNEDSAMGSAPDRGPESPASRNVRQKLAHHSYSESMPAIGRTGEASTAPSRMKPDVPGPAKTTVVISDVAYSTYFAFLYYVSTRYRSRVVCC